MNILRFFQRPRNGCTQSYSPADWMVHRWLFAAINFRNYARSLSRRADVETILLNVANGKRGLLSRDECRTLAMRLANCEAEPMAKDKP